MAVYGGGQVRTGADSSARLELLQGMVRLWAETIFTVKEYTVHQDKLVATLFLQEGRLWANVTTDQPHEFTVETASAVAAVRDTHFSVSVAPDQTTLVSVAQGEVELTARGESVTLSTGQQATVKPGKPPGPPEPISSEEAAWWVTAGDMPELVSFITPEPTAIPTPPPTPTSTPKPTIEATSEPTTKPTLTSTTEPTPTPTTEPTPTPTTEPTLTVTTVPTPTPTVVPTVTPIPAEPQSSAFQAADGQILTGMYYPPPTCSAPLTVVYFPWVRGDQADWQGVAALLPEDFAYGVFSITARGCEGGCGEPWDRPGWLLDYTAAVAAAKELPCAGQSRVVTMGSSVGADGAIYACGQAEDCLGALAFSPNGWLDVPYADEVARLVEQGKHVWAVSGQAETGATRLDRPDWSDYYREIVLPGEAHGNQLYHPATVRLIQDFLECAAASFALEKCATVSVTLPPGPPAINAINFPDQIPADSSSVEGTVRYIDPDGDINRVTFEVVSAVNFTPFEFKPLNSWVAGNATDGAFSFRLRCGTAQQVTLRVILHDATGNSSAPLNFSFNCQ
jgi:hypothetical protein